MWDGSRDQGTPRASPGQFALFATIVIASGWSAWDPVYPGNTWLQVGPVLLALPIAAWALRRWPLSFASALSITLFLLVHLFAAHWTYSYVPYNRWLIDLAGVDLDRAAGWSRNPFDRGVHFLFGLLAVPPATEIMVRHLAASRQWAMTVAVLSVLAVSAVYEVFEWGLTMGLSPENAGAYNGEQGDRFDAQKDMAMAWLGAMVALPFVVARRPAKPLEQHP